MDEVLVSARSFFPEGLAHLVRDFVGWEFQGTAVRSWTGGRRKADHAGWLFSSTYFQPLGEPRVRISDEFARNIGDMHWNARRCVLYDFDLVMRIYRRQGRDHGRKAHDPPGPFGQKMGDNRTKVGLSDGFVAYDGTRWEFESMHLPPALLDYIPHIAIDADTDQVFIA